MYCLFFSWSSSWREEVSLLAEPGPLKTRSNGGHCRSSSLPEDRKQSSSLDLFVEEGRLSGSFSVNLSFYIRLLLLYFLLRIGVDMWMLMNMNSCCIRPPDTYYTNPLGVEMDTFSKWKSCSAVMQEENEKAAIYITEKYDTLSHWKWVRTLVILISSARVLITAMLWCVL